MFEATHVQKPFARIEWRIAKRYIFARRSEGGVSTLALISFAGVALAVFAMIATLAVRSGFRTEYVDTVLGNQAHANLYPSKEVEYEGANYWAIPADANWITSLHTIAGVQTVEPIVYGQVMISMGERNAFTEVYGIENALLRQNRNLVDNGRSVGDPDRLGTGIAVGQGLAASLGISIGSRIVLTSANGTQTAFGVTPRQNAYDVVYIIDSGNNYVDKARVYLPLSEAQSFFNLEGLLSRIDIRVEDPERIEAVAPLLLETVQDAAMLQDWRENNAGFLSGLQAEDNIMFILVSILVLISSFTIAAGIIMLVKNKTKDIAILRTMGFSRGRIMRIFMIAGMILGLAGIFAGVVLGVLFVYYFDPIFAFVNWLIGGRAEDTFALSVVPDLNAELHVPDVIRTVLLASGVSLLMTYLPARKAAKLDPVRGLNDE